MASRPLILATLVGASIGVPYVISHRSDIVNQVSGSSTAPAQAAGAAGSATHYAVKSEPPVPFETPGSSLYTSLVPLEGTRYQSLAEVLRMDVTKEWVYSRWARKSTGLADPDYYGIRVPLVTGTGVSDLAGSLTYYFNSQGQVQHISFVGRTADPSQLAQFVTNTYKLQRVEAAAGEQLYQTKRSGKVQSELRTQPDGVLWTTSPHDSVLVVLELERPGSNRTLPPRASALDIPEVAAAAAPLPPADTSTGDAAKSQGGIMSTIFPEGARYATPDEEQQIRQQRWPE
jgi:Family of unknown function (DUF6690)